MNNGDSEKLRARLEIIERNKARCLADALRCSAKLEREYRECCDRASDNARNAHLLSESAQRYRLKSSTPQSSALYRTKTYQLLCCTMRERYERSEIKEREQGAELERECRQTEARVQGLSRSRGNVQAFLRKLHRRRRAVLEAREREEFEESIFGNSTAYSCVNSGEQRE